MSNNGNQNGRSGSVSRRRFVQAAGSVGVAAGLAGCGGGGGGGSGGGSGTVGGKVTVFAGGAYNKNEKKFQQALYDAGLPKSIDVQMTTGPQATGGKQKKLKVAIDSQAKDPDLVLTDNGWTIPFIVRGDLVNLEKEMSDEFISKVKKEGVQSMLKTGTHPKTGDLYSVPVFPDFPTVQYRKDIFKNIGYSESDFSKWQKNPPGWAEFSKIVSEAKQNSGLKYGHVWQGNNYVGLACCTFNEFLTSMGGAFFKNKDNLFGPVGKRPVTIGNKKAIDGIELARDLIYGGGESPLDVKGVSPKEVAGWIEPDTKSIFESVKKKPKDAAVTQRNWTYAIGGAATAFKGTDAELGVMPLPKGPNGSWHAQGGWIMSMNPYSDNKASAKEVIKAWWKDSFLKKQLDIANFMPPKPSLYSYVEKHPTYGPYFKPLQYSAQNLIPRPTTSVWPSQRTIVASEVNAALRKKKSPQAAAQTMEKKIKAIEKQASGG